VAKRPCRRNTRVSTNQDSQAGAPIMAEAALLLPGSWHIASSHISARRLCESTLPASSCKCLCLWTSPNSGGTLATLPSHDIARTLSSSSVQHLPIRGTLFCCNLPFAFLRFVTMTSFSNISNGMRSLHIVESEAPPTSSNNRLSGRLPRKILVAVDFGEANLLPKLVFVKMCQD
jgi:hypothetical protein